MLQSKQSEPARTGYMEHMSDLEKRNSLDASDNPESPDSEQGGKSASFYLSFLALSMSVFIVSLDVTALAVAIPVAIPPVDPIVLGC